MGNRIYAKARFAYNNKPLKWWEENNPILENGEPAIVSDTDSDEWLKIGDGVTPWADLPWKTFLQTDESYNPTSENAQSGVAVSQALATVEQKNKILDFITYEINSNDTVTITGCDTALSGFCYIPETIEGCIVNEIDNSAFKDCVHINRITIPDTVMRIGGGAFRGCTNLAVVTIPRDITTISVNAFADCTSLKRVYYNNSKSYWNKVLGINVRTGNGALVNATKFYRAYEMSEIDQTYTPESENPQSGIAVAEALSKIKTDQTYDPESENAQSGVATAEGIALSVGDINSVLATVIGGSAVLPQSIINKVVEKAAAGVEKQVGGRFVTAVAVRDTGSIAVEPNAAYFIISNSESGKITVYDRTTEEPVEFTGKMIGMITGNYGDTNPSSVLGLVGIYSSAIIRKGTYLAIDSSKTATFSWVGEATVITVKNVKGE